MNSAALVAARIDRMTADPPQGGIVRDASGEPTGALKEDAVQLVKRALPPRTADEKSRALKKGLELLGRAGPDRRARREPGARGPARARAGRGGAGAEGARVRGPAHGEGPASGVDRPLRRAADEVREPPAAGGGGQGLHRRGGGDAHRRLLRALRRRRGLGHSALHDRGAAAYGGRLRQGEVPGPPSRERRSCDRSRPGRLREGRGRSVAPAPHRAHRGAAPPGPPSLQGAGRRRVEPGALRGAGAGTLGGLPASPRAARRAGDAVQGHRRRGGGPGLRQRLAGLSAERAGRDPLRGDADLGRWQARRGLGARAEDRRGGRPPPLHARRGLRGVRRDDARDARRGQARRPRGPVRRRHRHPARGDPRRQRSCSPWSAGRTPTAPGSSEPWPPTRARRSW